MREDNGGGLGPGQLRPAGRAVAAAVPAIVEQLVAGGSTAILRDALVLLERPLLAHVLAMTGGNQLRAARLLGLNRNTLRKRCRELELSVARVAPAPAAPQTVPSN